MPGKYCSYGTCRNRSTNVGIQKHLEGVQWHPFPKPWSKDPVKKEQSHIWLRALGRKGITAANITKDYYVCSLHFVGGKGPTKDYPNPVPCGATPFEVQHWLKTTKARQSPLDRAMTKNHNVSSIALMDTNNTIATSNIAQVSTPVIVSQAVKGDDLIRNPVPTHKQALKDSDILNLQMDHNDSNLTSVSAEVSSPVIVHEGVVQGGSTSQPDNLAVPPRKRRSNAADPVQPKVIILRETKPLMKDSSSQTMIEFDDIKPYSNGELMDTPMLKRRLLLNDITKDDKSAKFYTGLTLFKLAHLFSLLKDKASRLNFWKGSATKDVGSQRGRYRDLSLYEQYLLTLMRLRRGIEVQHAADIFGISTSVVSRTFTTWINFLAFELQFLLKWPNKEQILRKLPKSFRKHFPRTRGIIDCTEIFVQRPSRPTSQRRTWSSYKHHNTYKALVSVTPRGVFNFVSKLWSGNTSDKKIVQSSGLLDKIEHGDDIMADRGFLIRDLLALRGATLNIPPFANGRQLSASAVTKTRRIAKARIHVERAIGRLKNFNILSGIMPITLQDISNQILQVCGALCNMDKVLNK